MPRLPWPPLAGRLRPARLLPWLLFGAQFALVDLALRGLDPYRTRPLHLLAALGSTAAWLALAALARTRPARLALALLAALLQVLPGAFFLRYRVPFDDQALQAAARYWRDVLPLLGPRLPWLLGALALVTLAELSLLSRSPRRPSRSPALLALGLGLGALIGIGPSTPEARLLAAPASYRPPAPASSAGPMALPEVPVTRVPPSVILIVTESVRADSYCSAPTPDCPFSPDVNALLPGRFDLQRMRSIASFTVISMAALTTGRPQAVPRDALLGYPTAFELAHTLRGPGGERITTAYWAAHCHPMFERASVDQAIDRCSMLEDLAGDPFWHDDLDDKLLDHFTRELPRLPRPFFLILQLAGTHAPYSLDPDHAPFQPWTHDVEWDRMPQLFNKYRNAIHRQDRLLARALAPLVSSPEFDDTVLLFTSDHGEEFGEHRQIHHGQDVFDSQIRVPFWVATGGPALTAAQRAALGANREATATHLDILPTLLDVWGLLGTFPLEAHLHSLPGRSLLRPLGRLPRPIPLTNCTEAFPCPFRNAGMLGDGHKIESQAWDPGWNCWRTDAGHEQGAANDSPPCRALIEASRNWFPELPNGKPNKGQR